MPAETSAPETEPGAPVPKDAVDPELVSLRPRTQVGLVTAAAVLVFCAFIAVRLWPDFQFAGEGSPRATTVEEIARGAVGGESYVTVPVTLERAATVRVRKAKGVPGLRLSPVAGSGDQLWIVLDGDGWSTPRDGATYTGRLRRLSELPFEGSFRDQVRASPEPRYVSIDELRRALGAHDDHLTAVTGDAFTVAAGDPVDLVFPDPDAMTIVVSFNARFPDVPAWTAALASAGLVAADAQPTRTEDQSAWYDVHRSGALTDAGKMLEAAQLYGARAEPVTRRYRAPWPLASDATGVTAEGRAVAWSAVEVAAVHAARPLPSDPYVLLVGESPDGYWYVRPLYVVLALFAFLFAWALARTVRRELLGPKAPAQA